MTQSQLPITRTTPTLPFDKLSPRDFERLCLWLADSIRALFALGYGSARGLEAEGS